MHASGNLVQTLLRHSMVDVFHLWLFPFVLGSGRRLFSDGSSPPRSSSSTGKISSTGVLMGTYEPAGGMVTGSLAL